MSNKNDPFRHLPTAFFDKKHCAGEIALRQICTVSTRTEASRCRIIFVIAESLQKPHKLLFYVHSSCIWPSILMANTSCIRGDTLVTMPLTKTICIGWDKLELPPPGGKPATNTALDRPLKCCTLPQVLLRVILRIQRAIFGQSWQHCLTYLEYNSQ